MNTPRQQAVSARRGWGRRSLLGHIGAVLLVAPLLQRSRSVRGEVTKRLLIFHTPNGMEHLSSPAPAFAPLSADILMVRGIHYKSLENSVVNADAHLKGQAGAWTAHVNRFGAPAGASIDQHLVAQLKPTTRFTSLELCVQGASSGLLYRQGPRGPLAVVASVDPAKSFDRVLGGMVGHDTHDLPRIRRRRQSVLDHVKDELTSVAPTLTSEERQKLELHLDTLRSIEKRVATQGEAGSQTTTCHSAELKAKVETLKNDYVAHGALQMDLMALTLACGLTNIGSIRWSTSSSDVRHTWINSSRAWHNGLAHGGGGAADEFRRVTHWYAEQFASLIKRLKAYPEAGGSVLDNALVIWGSDMANGGHGFRGATFVIGGKCGGAIRPGRTQTYSDGGQNDFFAALCHAMGAPTEKFGNPLFASRPLSGLA